MISECSRALFLGQIRLMADPLQGNDFNRSTVQRATGEAVRGCDAPPNLISAIDLHIAGEGGQLPKGSIPSHQKTSTLTLTAPYPQHTFDSIN